MNQKEIRRNRGKETARERRHRRRKKMILIQKTVITLAGVVLIAGGILFAYFLIPDIKVAKQLNEASAYIETQAYDDAIASCEQALKIDSSSVRAYRAMAGAYLTKEDTSSAEQILYKGWETTQDESLLQYYCTVLLNEAVGDINAKSCTLDTLERCVAVIEKDPANQDVYELLNVCYNRLFTGEPQQENLLCNVSAEGICGYERYQDMLNRMLLIYRTNASDELKTAIIRLSLPENPVLWMEISHLQEYRDLLNKVKKIENSSSLSELIACIEKAIEMQNFFEEAFTIFESGEFDLIKAFMNQEEYISIRDHFISETMEYWAGKTYIPVSREKMKLIHEDGSRKFAFADYSECENKSAVINVWGAKQEDAGVQRLCISYEPAAENGEYFPHTTYEFIYLYCNVQIGNEYVPRMNYRFETKTATPEGTITQLIGDWGGEHEWKTEY